MGDIYQTFGKNLRTFRRQAGLTQEKLAEISGVGAKFISDLERKKKKASLETVSRLSAALDVSLDILLSSQKVLPNPPEDKYFSYFSRRIKNLSPQKRKKIFRILEDILNLSQVKKLSGKFSSERAEFFKKTE